jgi:hypothetical protein
VIRLFRKIKAKMGSSIIVGGSGSSAPVGIGKAKIGSTFKVG